MQLVFGIVVFVFGVLLTRRCVSNYRENLIGPILDDVWDYVMGHMLSIGAGVTMVAIGGVMILQFFHLEFSGRFPFVERRPVPEAIQRPL